MKISRGAVYSNTRSPLKGNIGYANIDVLAQGSAPSSATTTTPSTSMVTAAIRSPSVSSASEPIPTTRCSAKTNSAAMSAAHHSATTGGLTRFPCRREPAQISAAPRFRRYRARQWTAGPRPGRPASTDSRSVGAGRAPAACWSKTDLRGENTCSGVGGPRCQSIINNVGTVTGRLGYAWDRAMLYAEAAARAARSTTRCWATPVSKPRLRHLRGFPPRAGSSAEDWRTR